MMKRQMIVCTLLGVCSTYQVSAHIYKMSNHTNEPLKVRAHLGGDFDEWYERIIPPKSYREWRWTWLFTDESYERRKAGLCLDKIEVAMPRKIRKKALGPDGTVIGFVDEIVKTKVRGKDKVVWGPPAAVVVKWVKDEGVDAMIKAAESFSDNIQSLASDVASAATSLK